MATLKSSSLTLLIFPLFFLSCNTSQHTVQNKKEEFPTGALSFLTTRDGNFEIYTMNVDGSNLKNISNNKATDYSTSWSPDAKYILFYSNRDGHQQIYRMNADGSNQSNISNNKFNDFLPSWSPDGKQILFTSDRDHTSKEIYIMNADGSSVKRLTFDEDYNESPSWSPDMKKIIYTRQLKERIDTSLVSNGEIFIMDADGKNETRLTNKKKFDSGASYSPDGKKIAFYGESPEGNWDIFIMEADGTNMLNLTDDIAEDYSPTWSPDGKWIAYTSGTSKQYDVWVIHVETRKKIQLTNVPKRNQNPVWRPK